MIGLLSLFMMASASDVAKPCIGVAINSQLGPVNLLGFLATGPKGGIEKLIAADRKLGGAKVTPTRGPDGRWTVVIMFVSPPMTSVAAVDLVQRAKSGTFGTLTVNTETMDLKTLEGCPRR